MMQELVDFTRGAPANVVLPKIIYADFLRDTLLDLHASASRRGVRLMVEGELPAVRLRLDSARFSRVFMNLAQNAFDAVSEVSNPTLTIRFSVTPTHVVTEFSDNGKGIESQNLPHLFEPFFTHGKEHGTGLGLPICERIVQDHGGIITARSQPEKGATFSFVLPIPVPGDTDQIVKVRDLVGNAAI
jgi:signal transduction histidine kinase